MNTTDKTNSARTDEPASGPVAVTDPCPAAPDEAPPSYHRRGPDGRTVEGIHECNARERRCVYCGATLIPYQRHGCGRWISADGMAAGATRCDACE